MTAVDVHDLRVIDADTHVVEPYDLWTSRVDGRWKDDVPTVGWSEEKGQDVWMLGGVPFASATSAAQAGWHEFPPSRPPRLSDADPATWDARERVRAMDRYGISAQVLYPNVAGFGGGRYLQIADSELRKRCVAIYNDWLTEWTSVAPERFIMNCSIPFWDIDAALEEMTRCFELGHRGIVFSSQPHRFGQPHIADPHWDPIWARAQELRMPINFHIGGGGIGDFQWQLDSYAGNGLRTNYAINSTLIFLSNAQAVVDVIMGGVCARFPELSFVSVESGVGWVPFILETMDWQWCSTGLHRERPDRLLPSEYFRRQFYACFWFEQQSLQAAIDVIGTDRLLYESDFPHATSQWPGPASFGTSVGDYVGRALGAYPAETIEKIVHGNAARLYHWTS